MRRYIIMHPKAGGKWSYFWRASLRDLKRHWQAGEYTFMICGKFEWIPE